MEAVPSPATGSKCGGEGVPLMCDSRILPLMRGKATDSQSRKLVLSNLTKAFWVDDPKRGKARARDSWEVLWVETEEDDDIGEFVAIITRYMLWYQDRNLAQSMIGFILKNDTSVYIHKTLGLGWLLCYWYSSYTAELTNIITTNYIFTLTNIECWRLGDNIYVDSYFLFSFKQYCKI